MLTLLTLLVALIAPFGAPANASDPPRLSIAAIRASATDLNASADFYTKHLGFEMADDMRDLGYVVLANDDHVLVVSQAQQPVAIKDGCYTQLNFHVADLDAAVEALKKAHVTFRGWGEAAIGRIASFEDPDGHPFNLIQLHEEGRSSDAPRVYNVSIRVSDMDRAVRFYNETLGIPVRTKDYYPPVVVFEEAGAAYFILHDSKTDDPAPYTPDAFVGLAFEVENISDAMSTLSERGVRFLSPEPQDVGPVLVATFRDPFGAVHELIQHKDSSEEADQPTLDDLAFLAGRWTWRRSTGYHEEHWLAPADGNMTGTMRAVRAGKVTLVELFTITREEDGRLIYRLRHFDPTLTPWASEAEGPIVGVVEHAEHGKAIIRPLERGGGIDTLTYELTDPDTLVATLSFPAESGQDPFVLTFERADGRD